MHFFKRPKVEHASYDKKTNILKACTTAKNAEIGTLYLGMRLRNYYLRGTLVGPTPAVYGAIYRFERDDFCTIDDGLLKVKINPFYGGFLSKSYEGLCYVRCVRIGRYGTIMPRQVHIAPLCCLSMNVNPMVTYVSKNGVEIELEGGKTLRGKIYSDKKVTVSICRMNKSMLLKFSEPILTLHSGMCTFSWKPFAIERGVVTFGDITGKGIVKTFKLEGIPYILSDVTHASNEIFLNVEWGKLRKGRISVPIRVNCGNPLESSKRA